MPPARRLVCSPGASTWLGRASGYGCHTVIAIGVRWSQDPAGSADADINININIILTLLTLEWVGVGV